MIRGVLVDELYRQAQEKGKAEPSPREMSKITARFCFHAFLSAEARERIAAILRGDFDAQAAEYQDAKVAAEDAKVKEPGSVPVEVELVNGVPMVSSKKVADVFGKEHYDVLEKIDALIKDTNEIGEFGNARNFPAVTYQDAKGETRRAFMLSRDAFSLLAMGFTGKRALRWKLDYITAFNQMEAALIEQAKVPAIAMDTAGLEAKLEEMLSGKLEDARVWYQRVITEYIGEEVASVEMGLRGYSEASLKATPSSVHLASRSPPFARAALGP